MQMLQDDNKIMDNQIEASVIFAEKVERFQPTPLP